MKWTRKPIPVEQLSGLINTLEQMIKQGDNRIEKFRCVYIENNTPHVLTVCDFLDLDPKPEISKFFFYQAFNN